MPVARLVGVGAFVTIGLLLFTVALFMIGDRQMAFADRFVLYTEFTTITGLQPGSIVRVSGANAGTVRAIDPPTEPAGRFRVRLEIAERLHQLVRTDSVAAIETEGLVGGSFLAVSTGRADAPQAPDGSTIPSREPFAISTLMQQMTDTITRVNETIDDLRGRIDTALGALGETVGNANVLVDDVSAEIKAIASAGARISADVAELSEGIRRGEGTIGRLVKDEDLYERATSIARSVEEIAADARSLIEQARQALSGFQADGGPVAGVAADVTRTLGDARVTMAALADNLEALKRNFFFRGFFNNRGYFNLADISPAEYRKGALAGGDRRPVRVWLHDSVLFERAADASAEQLTDGGQARLESAIAPYLDRLAGTVLIVEGYAQEGSQEQRYLTSRARAAAARDHLIGRFGLDPQATGLMPLGAEAAGSPDGTPWSGVALAVFLEQP